MAKKTTTVGDNSKLIQAIAGLEPIKYRCPVRDKSGSGADLMVMLMPVFSSEPMEMKDPNQIATEGSRKGRYTRKKGHKGNFFYQCSYSGSIGPCCRHCEQVKGYSSPPA